MERGPADVLGRYGVSGRCHFDLSVLNGLLPIPAAEHLGHEGAGTVEAVSSGVEKVKVGDAVVAGFIPPGGSVGTPCAVRASCATSGSSLRRSSRSPTAPSSCGAPPSPSAR